MNGTLIDYYVNRIDSCLLTPVLVLGRFGLLHVFAKILLYGFFDLALRRPVTVFAAHPARRFRFALVERLFLLLLIGLAFVLLDVEVSAHLIELGLEFRVVRVVFW